LHGELDILNSTLAKLGDDIRALPEKIIDAKARQNAIIMRGKAAHSRLDVRRTLSDHNIDGAISRFEQYERKMDDLEGQIESYDLGQKSLADEISELEGDENVDAMLEDLKARMASTDGAKEQAAGGSVASKQDKQ
jgi:phage shock protein A